MTIPIIKYDTLLIIGIKVLNFLTSIVIIEKQFLLFGLGLFFPIPDLTCYFLFVLLDFVYKFF